MRRMVRRHAHERPLGVHPVQPSQAELLQAQRVLDPALGRLGDPLALAAGRSSCVGLQLGVDLGVLLAFPDQPHHLDRVDRVVATVRTALGLRASTTGDSAAALAYLKRAVARAPDHAQAHWALAAEYAALRMPDRAAEHFARTVEIDPAQPIARFQYGLLRLTSGDVPAATALWAPLDDLLPTDHPVRQFKQGLLHMVADQFEPALRLIRAAADHPAVDPALRKDMEMTIARIEAAQAGGAKAATPPPATLPAAQEAGAAGTADVSAHSHLALSAYSGSGSGGRRH